MKNSINFQKKFVFLLLILLMLMRPAFAEIYKWVDESGKVHFGDKPKDSATLEASEKVELNESYVPGPGLAPEQVEAQQAYLRRMDRQREQKKQEAEKTATKRDEASANCASIRDRLKDFTDIGMKNGQRKAVDYFIENGKTVSSKRQKEIIAEMQENFAKKCT